MQNCKNLNIHIIETRIPVIKIQLNIPGVTLSKN